jgi:preprotein translocase subunit SecF
MATRKVWYALSVALMIVSISSLFTRSLNLAIDFTGGITVQASFPRTANIDAVRTRLVAAGFRDPQVQNFGSSREVAIRLPPQGQLGQPGQQESGVIRAKVEGALQAVDPGAQIESLEVVGPRSPARCSVSAPISRCAFTPGGSGSARSSP